VVTPRHFTLSPKHETEALLTEETADTFGFAPTGNDLATVDTSFSDADNRDATAG